MRNFMFILALGVPAIAAVPFRQPIQGKADVTFDALASYQGLHRHLQREPGVRPMPLVSGNLGDPLTDRERQVYALGMIAVAAQWWTTAYAKSTDSLVFEEEYPPELLALGLDGTSRSANAILLTS